MSQSMCDAWAVMPGQLIRCLAAIDAIGPPWLHPWETVVHPQNAAKITTDQSLTIHVDIGPSRFHRRHPGMNPDGMASTGPTKLLFDFADPSAADTWRAIDDRVMGGASRSRLRHDPAGHAVFEGIVSLERNGGFASVRSSAGERGLAGARACLIDCRGSHQQFKLKLLTDDGFDSLTYQANMAPAGTGWQTLELPLADFRATFRGRDVPDAPALDPARIRQVGLTIASRQAGPFEFHLRRIGLV